MKIIIDIPKDYYEIIKHDVEKGMDYLPCVLIAEGTPLPKGHGRLIDVNEVVRLTNESKDIHGALWKASTIIEADKESEGEK